MKWFMRKWILMIMMAMLPGFLMVTNCFAKYLIELKNGTTIVTDHYWEENGQICYYHLGGVVGVADDMVLSITDTDAPVPEEIIQKDPLLSENQSLLIESTEEHEFENMVVEYQEQLTTNHKDIVNNVKNYYSAMRLKDQRTMDEAKNHIHQLQSEQKLLKQEILDLYQGVLPDWWYDITEEY